MADHNQTRKAAATGAALPSANTPFHTPIGVINRLRVAMHDGRASNTVKRQKVGRKWRLKWPGEERPLKVKHRAVKALLKAFRAVLFGLLSPKRSTRETATLRETPSAAQGERWVALTEKAPEVFKMVSIKD